MKDFYTPILIEINSNDLSFVEKSWSNKTITQSTGSIINTKLQDIFYYPQINLIILPRYYNQNGIFLNIATSPYSNYTWCGSNGFPATNYAIYESPYDCPLWNYDNELRKIIFDEKSNRLSSIMASSYE
jgi:hypothetical protein